MRLLFAILLAGFCGCTSKQPSSDGFTFVEYQQRLQEVSPIAAPSPTHTPYDADASSRVAYLDSYRDGYRSGLTGFYITPLFELHDHHRERVDGYYDGQSADWSIWAEKHLGPGQHFYGERPKLAVD